MTWKHLRLGLAIAALALMAVPQYLRAETGCPWVVIVSDCGHGNTTCGNFAGDSCARCSYYCGSMSDTHVWDMCDT